MAVGDRELASKEWLLEGGYRNHVSVAMGGLECVTYSVSLPASINRWGRCLHDFE